MHTGIRGGLLRYKNSFPFVILEMRIAIIMKSIFTIIFSVAILLTCQRGYAQSGQDHLNNRTNIDGENFSIKFSYP